MDRNELERRFSEAERADDVGIHLGFKELLLETRTNEMCAYHLELISRAKNDALANTLATFFSWRGQQGEDYLAERLPRETNPLLLATGLQILGRMRSRKAAALARGSLEHEVAVVRERACMVLGWVGTTRDLKLLARLQREDPDINTRKWAATQQMHIADRLPKAKAPALANLAAALEHEQHTEVLEMIIYSAQSLLKRRFGLRQEPGSRRMVGDLDEARRKAKVALGNYLRKHGSSRSARTTRSRG